MHEDHYRREPEEVNWAALLLAPVAVGNLAVRFLLRLLLVLAHFASFSLRILNEPTFV
jgi:hypothetical protein